MCSVSKNTNGGKCQFQSFVHRYCCLTYSSKRIDLTTSASNSTTEIPIPSVHCVTARSHTMTLLQRVKEPSTTSSFLLQSISPVCSHLAHISASHADLASFQCFYHLSRGVSINFMCSVSCITRRITGVQSSYFHTPCPLLGNLRPCLAETRY